MSEDEGKKPKWGYRKRLEYIDFRLFWDGRLNRQELADAFGMSAQQASADIAEYQRLEPGNLLYDATQKAFIRGPDFRAAWVGESADRYLLQLVGLESGWMDPRDTWFQAKPDIEVVALRRPPTNGANLMAVLDALRGRQEIQIYYRSMTGSPPSWRGVAPHALAYAGGRWYVRAWSRDHGEFRDYSLNRISEVGELRPSTIDFSLDYAWHQKIDLVLTPHPGLSPERRPAVEEEWAMVDGRLSVAVRLSMSFYLMAEFNLDLPVDTFPAERQQLALENRDEVVSARALAQKMSTQALQRAALA